MEQSSAGQYNHVILHVQQTMSSNDQKIQSVIDSAPIDETELTGNSWHSPNEFK